MGTTRIGLGQSSMPEQITDLVREARELIGWTQRGLAARAHTSQSMVRRIEAAAADLDMRVLASVLAALGIRAVLDLDGRHLEDRRHQRGALHSRLNGYVARQLARDAWLTASEVQLGSEAPKGWIDLLGFREADRSLLVEETKTVIDDLGALQRTVGFYAREVWSAARERGWRPLRVVVLVVALDTEAVARRLADQRDLVRQAFPGRVDLAAAWLADPRRPPPDGWVLGTADPARRRSDWLGATTLGGRRRPPAYADYAAAASRLLRA
jgi:transcriptional regulator with XRE-family HTH domain